MCPKVGALTHSRGRCTWNMLMLLKSTKAPFSMFVTLQLWMRMRLKLRTPLKAPLSMLSK